MLILVHLTILIALEERKNKEGGKNDAGEYPQQTAPTLRAGWVPRPAGSHNARYQPEDLATYLTDP